MDAENVPTYEDLQDASRFELVAGISHDLDEAGVEVGLYLGGTRLDVQRQAFLGLRHVDKETDLESFTVHDYGSIVPATLKEAHEKATPLSPEYIEAEWSTGSNIIAGYGYWKDAMLFEIEKRPALFDSAGWQKELKWAGRAAHAFKAIGAALDIYPWAEGKERAIQYGADLAKPKCQHGLTTSVTWGTVGEPVTFNAKHDWNALHQEKYPEFVARELKITFERQEVIAKSIQGVEFLFTRYKITESMNLEATDTEEVAGWQRSTWAIVDHRPLWPDPRFPESFAMEESVYRHHEQVDASTLAESYRESDVGDTFDIRKTLIHVINAIRRKDYDPKEGRFFNTHTIASIADAVYLDRSRVWAAWDQPRMPYEVSFTQTGIEGQIFKQPPELPDLDENSCYVVGEPRQDTPPPPPRDTTPPPRPNIFIDSPTTVYQPTIVVSGYTEPGALVRVVEHQHGTDEAFENAVPFSSGEADEHGRFDIRLPLVADAANVFSFAAEDGAGNLSEAVKTPAIYYRETPEGLRELLPYLMSEDPFNNTTLSYDLYRNHNLDRTNYETVRHGFFPPEHETDERWHYSRPRLEYYSLEDRDTEATTHILEVTLEYSGYDRINERPLTSFESSVLINVGETETNTGELPLDEQLFLSSKLNEFATPAEGVYDAYLDAGESWKLLDDYVTNITTVLSEAGVDPIWVSETIDRTLIQEGPGIQAIVDRKDYRNGSTTGSTRLLGASDRLVMMQGGLGELDIYDSLTEKFETLQHSGSFVNWYIDENVYPVNDKLVFTAYSTTEEVDPSLGYQRYLGRELWTTDGTQEGTRMLANLTTMDDGDGPIRTHSQCDALGIVNYFYFNYYCVDRARTQTYPTGFVKGAEGLYFVQYRDMEYALQGRGATLLAGRLQGDGRRWDIYFTDGDSVTKVMSQDFDGGRFYFPELISNDAGAVFLTASQSSAGGAVTFQLTPEGPRPIFDAEMAWANGDIAYFHSQPPVVVNLRTGERFDTSGEQFKRYVFTPRGDVIEVFDYETETTEYWLTDGSQVDLPELPNDSSKVAVIDNEYYVFSIPTPTKLEGGQWKPFGNDYGFQKFGSLAFNDRQVFGSSQTALPVGNTADEHSFISDSYLYHTYDGIIYRIDAGLSDVEPNTVEAAAMEIDFDPPADDVYVHSHDDIPIEIEGRVGQDGVTVTKFSIDLPNDSHQSTFRSGPTYYATQGEFILARYFPGTADNLVVEFWRADLERGVLEYLPTPGPYVPFRGVYDYIREDGFYVRYVEKDPDEYWKLDGDEFVVVDAIPDEEEEPLPHFLGLDIPDRGSSSIPPIVLKGGDSVTSVARDLIGEFLSNKTFFLATSSGDTQSPSVEIAGVRQSEEVSNSLIVSGTTEPGAMVSNAAVDSSALDIFFAPYFPTPSVITADSEGHFEIPIPKPNNGQTNGAKLLVFGANGYVTELDTASLVATAIPFHNFENQYDVNGDGIVSPIDVLLIVNRLNALGAGRLPSNVEPEPNENHRVDTNADQHLSPLDALLIINHLNANTSAPESESVARLRPLAQRKREDLVDAVHGMDDPLLGQGKDRDTALWAARTTME